MVGSVDGVVGRFAADGAEQWQQSASELAMNRAGLLVLVGRHGGGGPMKIVTVDPAGATTLVSECTDVEIDRVAIGDDGEIRVNGDEREGDESSAWLAAFAPP